jgi:putative ABC transport system substrate-binding protein
MLGVGLSLCSGAPSFAADIKQSTGVYRIGVLGAGSAQHNSPSMNAFRSGLRDLGWTEGRIVFVERWANGRYEELLALASDLVALKVDLILAADGTLSAEAAMKATREIPIVLAHVGDPLGQKLVRSLSRPGGNVTGPSVMGPELMAKELALLKEAMPGIRTVGLLVNSANPSTAEILRVIRASIQTLDMRLVIVEVLPLDDLDRRLNQMRNAGVQALMGVNLEQAFDTYLRFGLEHRLPMAGYADKPPGLLTLGTDDQQIYRHAAIYVDKILRGANPGELPIEQPTEIRLVINLKTATAFGLTIPRSFVLRADEVIQ